MPVIDESLTVVEPKDALALNREPDLVLTEAKKAAVALTDVIENNKRKKVTFNGKTYLQFEDWQTLGRFYGVTAMSMSTKYVEFGEGDEKIKGFEARAEALLVGTNQVISAAEAMCLDDEQNWSRKPLFQLKSMAQTRACAKALRNVLAWVVVLAGYAPTPAEEMEAEANGNSGIQAPRRKSVEIPKDIPDDPGMPEEINGPLLDASPAKTITDKQQKRLFAIAKSKGWSTEALRNLLGRHGFEHSKEIPMDKYNTIVAEIEAA